MRRWALALVVLAGCPAGEPRVSVARWVVTGNVSGSRAIDDQAGGRVSCTVDAERESVLDSKALLSVADKELASALDSILQSQPGLTTLSGKSFELRLTRGACSGAASAPAKGDDSSAAGGSSNVTR